MNTLFDPITLLRIDLFDLLSDSKCVCIDDFCVCVFVDLRVVGFDMRRSGHRAHVLVREHREQGLVSFRRFGLYFILQRVPQFLGLHHHPQHHGPHLSLRQVIPHTGVYLRFTIVTCC